MSIFRGVMILDLDLSSKNVPGVEKKTCFCFGTTSPPGLNPNLNLYLPLLLGGGLQLKLLKKNTGFEMTNLSKGLRCA